MNGEQNQEASVLKAVSRLMLASLFPLGAFALQLLFWAALRPFAWALFYPAVFFSSWIGGKWAGFVTTAVSALIAWWFFLPPRYSFEVDPPLSAVSLVVFTVMGILFSLTHERLRKANREAARQLSETIAAKSHLEERISERTAELVRLVQELRQKESDLRKSQEIARIGSWVLDQEGRLAWSEELYRIFGVSPERFALSIDSFFSIIHPDDRPAMQAWIAACSAGEEPGELEFRVIWQDGTLHYLSGRGELIRDADGRPAQMSGTGQDITERRQAESALRESEERLRLFIEYAPVPIAMFDREMRYLYVSRRWRSDYQLGDRELSGLSHYEVFPEITESWRELHRRGLAGEVLHADADRFERADGSLQWLRWEIRPWYDSEGKVGGIVIFSEDITERRRVVEELQQSEARFRTMVEALPQLAWIAKADGHVYWYNRRWYEYTGTTPEQMAGWGWQSVHDPQVLPAVMERWRASIASGAPFEMLFPLRAASGEYHPFLTRIEPLKDAEGKTVQWLGTNTDITQIKRAEDALQKLNEELELRVAQRTKELDELLAQQEAQNLELQAAYHELEVESGERIQILTELRQKEQILIHQSRLAAMGELLGYIAHQWRQPLNVLGLNLQVLGLSYKHGSFSEELLDEHVSKAMRIVQHLSRTIDDFRDFLVLNKEKSRFDVDQVIVKTVSLIEEKFKGEKIAIEVSSTGEPQATGYPNEYSHVILNLLTNARDAFLERKAVDARIRIRSWVEEGRSVVTITDNAGGIGEKIIDKVFDAYFTTKELGKGSGVGLFMSKMIIEKNMGGNLSVRNVEGGAEFRIEV